MRTPPSKRASLWPFVALIVLLTASLACGSGSTATPVPTVKTATPVTALEAATPVSESAQKAQPTTTVSEAAPPTKQPAEPATEPAATEPPPTTTTPEPVAVKTYLGDAVEKDGRGIAAVKVENPTKPGMFYTAEAGKKLVAVELILYNISADPLNSNPLSVQLIDQDGVTYTAELAARDEQLLTVTLDKGERVRGWIAFEVDEKSVPTAVQYTFELFGDSLEASLQARPEDAKPTEFSPANTTPPASKLGDVVEGYGYSLAASRLENPAKGSMFYKAPAGKKLVTVEITVGNASADKPLSVNPLNAYLIDSDGYVYGVELGARDGQIDTSMNDGLAPGRKMKGWVAFTVPKDAKPAAVKYHIGSFSDEAILAGLAK